MGYGRCLYEVAVGTLRGRGTISLGGGEGGRELTFGEVLRTCQLVRFDACH